MQIISITFFVFIATVYLLLYFIEHRTTNEKRSCYIANWILLIASYLFVIYADYRFAVVLLFLTVSTWFFAQNKNLTNIGIIIALLVLAYFKYTNFFVSSLSKLFGHEPTMLNIILPIGISFYVFSAIGYLVDVKREKISPRNFNDVALYLSFFPKITSGPLQKSKDFFKQIESNRRIGWGTFSPGIQIFMFGLFKKIVLANRLSLFVNQVYRTPNVFGSFTVFLAAIAYSLQIYFDFSGYSDMSIGVARIFGFIFPSNFNLPYLSHNVTELWKRWHITLSSFLHEYLYITLGGNKKGSFKTYRNLILTMLIGGIWHGANWTYIIWGGLHGSALVVHKVWMMITNSSSKKHFMVVNIFSIIVTFLFTTFCWIFFRADSLSHAFIIIHKILSFESGVEQPYMWLFVGIIILVLCSITAYIQSGKQDVESQKTNISIVKGYYPIVDLTELKGLIAFFVFSGLILCLACTNGSPFIYGNY